MEKCLIGDVSLDVCGLCVQTMEELPLDHESSSQQSFSNTDVTGLPPLVSSRNDLSTVFYGLINGDVNQGTQQSQNLHYMGHSRSTKSKRPSHFEHPAAADGVMGFNSSKLPYAGRGS